MGKIRDSLGNRLNPGTFYQHKDTQEVGRVSKSNKSYLTSGERIPLMMLSYSYASCLKPLSDPKFTEQYLRKQADFLKSKLERKESE